MPNDRPDPYLLARMRQQERAAYLGQLAHKLRWINWAAVAFCLVLGLDWALPMQEFVREPLLRQQPVSAGGTLANPQMAYQIETPHTRFRLHPSQMYRLQGASRVTVWRTPLLRVVRFVKAPAVVAGRTPFAPSGGRLYHSVLAAFPLALFLIAGVGLTLPFGPEARLNTAIVSGLLWIVTLALLVI
ncbi:hypothetical protein [Hymenobacter rubripertinctus]|uniref:Uncharacterized protein n=1 Tax=Hymenobacter rubripertinctus TaxID=2029981 RepID=A0A418QU33_9BACT|nr:hypothetical protein [Hymenobacter rubripertinctus]RIY08633.1 hypothetical protein D0T11_14055 [Hymenobacter rubripertinctus]